MKQSIFISICFAFLVISSCTNTETKTEKFKDDFNTIPDRVWVGKNYRAVPMEDWKVENGRLECNGERPEQRVNILTHLLTGKGNLELSIKSGLIHKDSVEGSAGFWIGMQDHTDNNYKSLAYFGRGINVGIHTRGYIFIDSVLTDLPKNFGIEDFTLKVTISENNGFHNLKLIAEDASHKIAEVTKTKLPRVKGMVAIVNNHYWIVKKDNGEEVVLNTADDMSNFWCNYEAGGPSFWFDDMEMKGSMLEYKPENKFGPILWSMYTLSKGTLKMTAQMPPVGDDDVQDVVLQIKKNKDWKTIATETIQPDACIVAFKIENWDATKDVVYQLVYTEKFTDGKEVQNYYNGTIQHDPVERPLVMGAMTCQEYRGFPYRPVVENLEKINPDILYFSGDNIYEQNGGYCWIRYPADRATLNYLGKWYMFGWAFGDLMRDRPTICIPDDHDVIQGNFWGAGGKKITKQEWEQNKNCASGFVQPAEMVNVVIKTNTSHLPDCYDTIQMIQGILPYHTELVYGRVSFAIVGDRHFKSGPESVSWWEGRKDHIKFKIDPSKLERPDLKFLGDRQLDFLNHWVTQWKGSDMKVLLSQTIFAGAATHMGPKKMFLFGDLDSGGWPKTARDKALKVARKAFAFHICGDQHLPMLAQYGVDQPGDAGWVICTPAIASCYERRFFPDKLGWEVKNRPRHGNPNTGDYRDFFGNYFYVYAVGNPADSTAYYNRYIRMNKRSSGFSIVTFDNSERSIKNESYKFLADLCNEKPDNQHEGFPHSISQFDNYGREAVAWLPKIKVEGMKNPVVIITNSKIKEVEYAVRIKGDTFSPKVFTNSNYTIRIGNPDKNNWKEYNNIKPSDIKDDGEISVKVF